MRNEKLAKPQEVNACTLISIAVIKAILSAKDEQEMATKIQEAHDNEQMRYRVSFPNAIAHGAGILETEAFAFPEFSNFFAEPTKQNLMAPADDQNLELIIENRNNFMIGNELSAEFYTFNFDLIEAIEERAAGTPIDWSTINKPELQRLVKQDGALPLAEQFLEVITQLDSQGITIKMEGHTISLVKRGDTCYSYDSLEGVLSVTKKPQEMVAHLAEKIDKNHAKGAEVYYFTPKQALKLAPEIPIKQETQVKKEIPATEQVLHQVEAVETAGLNAERIHDLIDNRASFDTVDDWQQVNAELFTLIASRLNGGYLTLKEWATITAKQLCDLLNIESNPVPIVSPHVSGRPSSTPLPVIEKTGVNQEELTTKKRNANDLETHIPDTSVKDAPEQPVKDSEKLIAIIDKLIENMSTQQNGRHTRRNSQWKADLLTDIKQGMQSTNPDAIDINQCIADIRTVCAKKRNILHFWAEPHSVSEFEKMLRDEEIATPQTNVLAQ